MSKIIVDSVNDQVAVDIVLSGIERGPAGPQGTQGAEGPQGPAGATGAQGPKGDTGAKGDAGSQGPQGVQGIQGEKGDTGPRGEKGDTGSTGPQGPQGIKGAQGPAGATGSKGDKGDKGDTGLQGATGATGAQGPKGDKGDTGNTGAQGPQGPQGIKGDTGARGIDGDSYEDVYIDPISGDINFYLSNGNESTGGNIREILNAYALSGDADSDRLLLKLDTEDYDSDKKVFFDIDSDQQAQIYALQTKDSEHNIRLNALEQYDSDFAQSVDSDLDILRAKDSDNLSQLNAKIDSEIQSLKNADSDNKAQTDSDINVLRDLIGEQVVELALGDLTDVQVATGSNKYTIVVTGNTSTTETLNGLYVSKETDNKILDDGNGTDTFVVDSGSNGIAYFYNEENDISFVFCTPYAVSPEFKFLKGDFADLNVGDVVTNALSSNPSDINNSQYPPVGDIPVNLGGGSVEPTTILATEHEQVLGWDSDLNKWVALTIAATYNDSELRVDLDSDIKTLRATDSDNKAEILAQVDSDIKTLRAVDSDFQVALDAEINDRVEGDSDLAKRIDSEIKLRLKGDSDLRSLVYRFRLEDTKSSQTWYVDPTGYDSDSDFGKRITKPYKTIGQAQKVVTQGGNVQINRGIYNETLTLAGNAAHRNTAWFANSQLGSSGTMTEIAAASLATTGTKLSGLRINGASTFNNTGTILIGNHYNEMLFASTASFLGGGFHEWHNCKMSGAVTFSGVGGKYAYDCQFESTLTLTGSAGMLTYIANSTLGSVTATGAGSFVVLKDIQAGAGAVITIGAGVVYSLLNCSGFTLNINAAAIKFEDYYVGTGVPASIAEGLVSTYFDGIKAARLKTKTLAVRNKAKVMMQDSDTLVLKQMTLTTKHLSNVSDSDAKEGQVLAWDSDSQLWRPEKVASASPGGAVDSDFVLRNDSENKAEILAQVDSDLNVLRATDSDINAVLNKKQFIYAKASVAITKGELVQFAGSQGDHILVQKSNITNPNFKAHFLVGLATQDVAHNAYSNFQCFGPLVNINTNGFNEGDVLYASDSEGKLTTTPGSKSIIVAAVTRKNSTKGSLMVRLQTTDISQAVVTVDSDFVLSQDSDLKVDVLARLDSDISVLRNADSDSKATIDSDIANLELNSLTDVVITSTAINETDSDIIVVTGNTNGLDGEYVKSTTVRGLYQSNDIWRVSASGAERYYYNASKSRSLVEIANTNLWKFFIGNWGLQATSNADVTANIVYSTVGVGDVNDLANTVYEPIANLIPQVGGGSTNYKLLSALGLLDGMILVWSASQGKWVNTSPDPGLDLGEF